MISKQLIIVTETNQKSQSDYMYINRFLEYFFLIDENVRIVPIFLNGKSNYDSRKIERKIEKLKKEFSYGDSFVVYCYDTDNYEIDARDRDFDQRINKYCDEKGYYLVHFSKDIEEVFLERSINNTSKTKEAIKFLRSRKIGSLDLSKFKSNNKRRYYSNLYLVFSQLLKPRIIH